MRADRLLSLLMLLQSRGKMTAQTLAKELAVSERTIYRDIDALSLSGVPVYGEAGPEGGYALLDSYRTRLTGLSTDEVRALFMLSVPAPLADLGISERLKSALLKLSASLPARHSGDEMRVRQRFLLDSTSWHASTAPIAHLSTLQEAVWSDGMVEIVYLGPLAIETAQRVAAYALVAKNGEWYLVYQFAERMRIQPVRDLVSARLLEEAFTRDTKFDLVAFWQNVGEERQIWQSRFSAHVRIMPQALTFVAANLGSTATNQVDQAEKDDEGWYIMELGFPSLFEARDRLLALGYAVEVIAPLALRRSILDVAAQVVMRYTKNTLSTETTMLPEDRPARSSP